MTKQETNAIARNLTRTQLYGWLNRIHPDEITLTNEKECEENIRKLEGYCTNPHMSSCSDCPLSDLGLDCHMMKIALDKQLPLC